MLSDIVLVINSGSSSIKFSAYLANDLSLLYHGNYDSGLQALFTWIESLANQYRLVAVGHRVVHGGTEFYLPTIVTPEVFAKLQNLIPLAPLHQPHNLEAIKIISSIYPKLLQVACFDTAFHQTQLKLATLFAIPASLTNAGIIRYGFHGLSYEYIASVLDTYLGKLASGKIVVAHLGNGASMCAMQQQKSVATSMGFTALDGLMMGTRCGSIDPGVILYLIQQKGYTAPAVEKLLYEQSGLLGVSNFSGDMRELLQKPTAETVAAIDLFCYRAARELGAMTTTLQGCDAIVFTAGIGENTPIVRQKICEWLTWMGVALDNSANQNNSNIISHKDSKILVAVIPTNEEYMIAKKTLDLA